MSSYRFIAMLVGTALQWVADFPGAPGARRRADAVWISGVVTH